MTALALVALTCGSFLMVSFLVFTKSRTENSMANRWLGLFLTFVGLLLLEDVLVRAEVFIRLPHLSGLFDWVVFSIAPCIYLAIRYFTSPNQKQRASTVLHFLPSLLFVLYHLPEYLLSTTAKQRLIEQASANGPWYESVFVAALSCQIILYWGFSLRQLLRHQKAIRQIRASVETVDLRWLLNVLIGVLLLLLFWLTEGFYRNHLATHIATTGYLVVAYYIGYYAMQQSSVYPYKPQDIAAITAIIEQKPVKLPTGAEELKAKLNQVMASQKPYLDNGLNLLQLADLMHLSTHELSALINTGLGTNFYQYVNAYRVEESKRLLTNPAYDHFSMVGIAYEAGFNSKTVFNTTFKTITGLSPTAYRRLRGTSTE